MILIAVETIPVRQVRSFAGILWESFTGSSSDTQADTGNKDLSLALAFSIPSLQLFFTVNVRIVSR